MNNSKKQFKDKSFLSLAFFYFIFAFSIISSHAAESVRIAVKGIEVNGLYSIKEDELLYLLDIKPGEATDPVRVRQGIKRAFLKGIFEDISVHRESGDVLRINVKERDVIDKIIISGNEHFSDRQVKRIFQLKEGDVMRYDLIEDSIEKLKQRLSERGFPHSNVSAQVGSAGKPYSVNLKLAVNEGMPEKIENIAIQGRELDIMHVLGLGKGDIFDRIELEEKIEKVKNYLKESGYINPSVGPYTFSNGELDIRIEPGLKLGIFFDGNKVFSAKELMKEMPFYEAEDFRADLVEEAVARIKFIYHGKGYPFVQIAPVTKREGDSIELHFFVHEGTNVAVGSVKFLGATVDEERLKAVMSMREGSAYNPEMLYAESETLREFYNALGYINAVVNEPEIRVENSQAHITIKVDEGNRVLINRVAVRGATLMPEEKIREAITVKQGDPYNEIDVSGAMHRIQEIYLEHGYMSIAVDVTMEFSEEMADIIFDVNEGEQSFFGKTIVTGNHGTKTRVIERELTHREGDAIRYSLLTKGRQKLYRIGLFTDVNIELVDKYNGKSDLLIEVKEGNAGAVEFGIGYADYEKYRGFFDISYRNLFGMNRQASFRTELSSLEERYMLNYYEPWFMDTPLQFKAQFLRERRTEKNIDTGSVSYRLEKYAFTAGVEKKLRNDLKGELYYEFSIVKTYDVQPDVVLTKEDTGTLAISSIRPGIIYDTRDNPFEPRKGVLAGLILKAASLAILSETNFVKATFTGSYYKEISKRLVGAVSFRGGIAHSFDESPELPLIERFFLGGRSTVRGYEQDTLGPKGSDGTPTGGNAFLMANLELRTYLGRDFGLVFFLDGGNVWHKIDDINMFFRYSAGIGLRYSTPVGPLRVDYGHKLNREDGESSGEIHFSIGHAF